MNIIPEDNTAVSLYYSSKNCIKEESITIINDLKSTTKNLIKLLKKAKALPEDYSFDGTPEKLLLLEKSARELYKLSRVSNKKSRKALLLADEISKLDIVSNTNPHIIRDKYMVILNELIEEFSQKYNYIIKGERSLFNFSSINFKNLKSEAEYMYSYNNNSYYTSSTADSISWANGESLSSNSIYTREIYLKDISVVAYKNILVFDFLNYEGYSLTPEALELVKILERLNTHFALNDSIKILETITTLQKSTLENLIIYFKGMLNFNINYNLTSEDFSGIITALEVLNPSILSSYTLTFLNEVEGTFLNIINMAKLLEI